MATFEVDRPHGARAALARRPSLTAERSHRADEWRHLAQHSEAFDPSDGERSRRVPWSRASAPVPDGTTQRTPRLPPLGSCSRNCRRAAFESTSVGSRVEVATATSAKPRTRTLGERHALLDDPSVERAHGELFVTNAEVQGIAVGRSRASEARSGELTSTFVVPCEWTLPSSAAASMSNLA